RVFHVTGVQTCALPICEIGAFLEDEFDYWFNQPMLRKTRPVFVKYLYYKTHTPYSPNMATLGDRAMDSYTTYDALNDDCWHTPRSEEHRVGQGEKARDE